VPILKVQLTCPTLYGETLCFFPRTAWGAYTQGSAYGGFFPDRNTPGHGTLEPLREIGQPHDFLLNAVD
jgi:hypothetical protein